MNDKSNKVRNEKTENQIALFKRLAIACTNTDFSNRAAIRKHNMAVDRMLEIALLIGNGKATETVDDFAELLNEEEHKVNLWAATHLLEHMKVTHETKAKALQVIQAAAAGEDPASMGYKQWLKDWEDRN